MAYFPESLVRIEQLGEALQIIKKMWMDEELTFHGKYSTVEKAENCYGTREKFEEPFLRYMEDKNISWVAWYFSFCLATGYDKKLEP